MTEETTTSQNNVLKTVLIGGLVIAAFFGAYRFASAGNGRAANAGAAPLQAATGPNSQSTGGSGGASGGADAAGAGCACCGGGGATTANGITGDPVSGKAEMSGGIQVVTVDVGSTYSPNVIKLKAGVPAEITFGQSSNCASQIVSEDLGFTADSSAGPRTVKLGALKAGTYSFHCSMNMVFGQIVVE